MIGYLVGGAWILVYIAYHTSTPERRRPWLARMKAPGPGALDDGTPVPYHRHHGHHGHGHGHGSDHHGVDFDVGDGGHHHQASRPAV